MRRLADGRGWRGVPRSVRRLSRRHPGETGIVLHRSGSGRPSSPTDVDRETVTVTPVRPGRARTAALQAWLDDSRLGRDRQEPAGGPEVLRSALRSGPPRWIGVAPGEHTIAFHGFDAPLRLQTVRLGPGDHFLIAYREPLRLPLRRPRPARWSLRALPGEAG